MVSEFRKDRGVWEPRKFVYDRDQLVEIVDSLCGTVDARTLADIRSWPARHATWWRLRTGRPTPSIALAARAIVSCQLATFPTAAE